MKIFSLRFTLLKRIMRTPVYTMDSSSTLGSAAKRMVAKKMGCLVIMEHKNAVGIITERDVLRLYSDGCKPSVKMTDLYSYPLQTLTPSSYVADAISMMHTQKIRRIPVVEGGGRLLGIVTASDIIKATNDYVKFHNQIQWFVFVTFILFLFGVLIYLATYAV